MPKNFAYSLVATAPSPATTGTSLVVTGGDGTKFPAAPFQATVWPSGLAPTTSNAEIVTVTGVATDTLTIVRAQEGSSARTVIVGDQIAATVTAGVVVQSHRYNPLTAALQDITLDRSTDFAATDTLEIGAAYSLEVPAASTLEPVPTVKQTEVQSFFGIYDFIESGCGWSADAAASTLLATMGDGYVWINGRRLRVNAVRGRSFTASTDTYVDFSDNGDGTAKVNFTETTNNASTGSPALAAGRLRNAVIVSGATNIAATASINQGQEDRILPIVSSIPYTVSDSLGNLICPRDPQRKVLSYRQITSTWTNAASTSAQQVTGLSCPVIVPTGRKVRITFTCSAQGTNTAAQNSTSAIWSGVVGSGTQLATASPNTASAGSGNPVSFFAINTPPSASTTYNLSLASNIAADAGFIIAGATSPASLIVELV